MLNCENLFISLIIDLCVHVMNANASFKQRLEESVKSPRGMGSCKLKDVMLRTKLVGSLARAVYAFDHGAISSVIKLSLYVLYVCLCVYALWIPFLKLLCIIMVFPIEQILVLMTKQNFLIVYV